MRPPTSPHTTILGAGLTGLATAYYLARQAARAGAGGGGGGRITLVDAAQRVGGWVDSGVYRVGLPRGAGGEGKGKEGEGEQTVDGWRDDKGGVVRRVDQDAHADTLAPNPPTTDELEVLLESGPRSIRPRGGIGAARMLQLLHDLDLASSLLPVDLAHPAATTRFILDPATRQLVRLPSSLRTLLFPGVPRAQRHPLTSALLPALLAEPFRRARPEAVAERASDGDTSVDALVRARLGPDLARLVSAMVHGIYAADTRALSVRAAFPILWDALAARGSIVRGLLFGTGGNKTRTGYAAWRRDGEARVWAALGELGKRREGWSLYGIRGGMGALTARLEEEVRRAGVEVRLGPGAEVRALDLREDGGSGDGTAPIEVRLADGTTLHSSRIISALPPTRLAALLPPHLALPHLTHNPATTVGVVNLVFPVPPARVHPAGFGYLVPRGESDAATRRDNPDGVLGVVFDSTAVEGLEHPEVASRATKLTVMLGGPHWASYRAGADSSDARPLPRTSDLPALALAHLRSVFPALPDPVLARAHIHTACIPTYAPGHGARVRALHEAARDGPWAGRLGLVGSGYGGVGVNDCVESAWEVVHGWEGAVPARAHGAGEGEDDARWTGLERWQAWE